MSTELVKAEAQPMAVREDDPQDLLRLAVERGADVGTIERLMTVRKELRAEAAKTAFDHALASFQAACPIIIKSKAVHEKTGAGVRYRFAPLDHIVAQTKELIRKHGFSFQLNAEVLDNRVKAICKITHELGHSESSEFMVPIDPKAFMGEAQKFASALTFAKRYAFCNAFGILTGDEDTDGAGEMPKPKGPNSLMGEKAETPDVVSMKKKLVDLTRSVSGVARGYALDDHARQSIEQYLIDEMIISDTESLADLPATRLAEVVAKVEKKLR